MTLFFSLLCKKKKKKIYASKKLQLCQKFSLHKPCQIMSLLETSIWHWQNLKSLGWEHAAFLKDSVYKVVSLLLGLHFRRERFLLLSWAGYLFLALACACKTSSTEIGQLMFKALWRTELPLHAYYLTSLGVVLMALVMFWYMICSDILPI